MMTIAEYLSTKRSELEQLHNQLSALERGRAAGREMICSNGKNITDDVIKEVGRQIAVLEGILAGYGGGA